MHKVHVVDYDPTWPLTFASLRAPIWEAVKDVALAVEHVGSTAVPGLAAKPVIDIDIVVPSPPRMTAVIERLALLGYVHRGTLGIEGREAFDSPMGLAAHHLYACVRGCAALANHLALRDYLRANPATAASYGALKTRLSEEFPTDMSKYISGKTAFLLDVLREAGFSDLTLDTIREANAGRF